MEQKKKSRQEKDKEGKKGEKGGRREEQREGEREGGRRKLMDVTDVCSGTSPNRVPLSSHPLDTYNNYFYKISH